MPQLVKRGKHVFGWTIIHDDYRIRVPDETFEEYKFNKTDKLILMTASKTSGGFLANTPESILNSKFADPIIQTIGYQKATDSFTCESMEIKQLGNRLICWAILDKERYIHVSKTWLDAFDIKTGEKLLVVRGSGVGPGLIHHGPIVKEALKHPELIECK
jgi:hypothetical protein